MLSGILILFEKSDITVFADAVPPISILVFFRGRSSHGIGVLYGG